MSVLPVTTGVRTGPPAPDVSYHDNHLFKKNKRNQLNFRN